MIKVYCDKCGCEIDYNTNGINVDFNSFGIVKFRYGLDIDELQLCTKCANKLYEFGKGKKREDCEIDAND